jgi:hypothetical protein
MVDSKYASKQEREIAKKIVAREREKLYEREAREKRDERERLIDSFSEMYAMPKAEIEQILSPEKNVKGKLLKYFKKFKQNNPQNAAKTPKTENIFDTGIDYFSPEFSGYGPRFSHTPLGKIEEATYWEEQGDSEGKKSNINPRAPIMYYSRALDFYLDAASMSSLYKKSVPEDIARVLGKFKKYTYNKIKKNESKKDFRAVKKEYESALKQTTEALKISSRDLTKKNLTNKLYLTLAGVGFLGVLFSLSSNFTGNVISTTNASNNSALGIIFLLAGLVGTFFYVKKR